MVNTTQRPHTNSQVPKRVSLGRWCSTSPTAEKDTSSDGGFGGGALRHGLTQIAARHTHSSNSAAILSTCLHIKLCAHAQLPCPALDSRLEMIVQCQLHIATRHTQLDTQIFYMYNVSVKIIMMGLVPQPGLT